MVNDNSLKIAVGGAVLTPSGAMVTDQFITLNVNVETLGLPPGSYNLRVATSGGESVFPNAIQVGYKSLVGEDEQLPPVPPLAINVYPNSFRLDYAPTNIIITGDFFNTKSTKVRYAELGDIRLGPPLTKKSGHGWPSPCRRGS